MYVMDLPSDAEIKAMRTDKLRVTLTDMVNRIRNAPTDSAMLQEILQEIRAGNDERKALREEISQLKQCNEEMTKELEDIKSKFPSRAETPVADVVRDTVKSTMQNEHMKSQLILGNVEENDEDQDFINNLCSKMNLEGKPIELKRIGHKSADRKRLIKASFQTQFDARAFKARYTQMKKEDADFPSIRVRQSRSKEEQFQFKKALTLAKGLNDDAKTADASYSFSVRENGDIWKFAKNNEGNWKRVRDWVAPDENNTPSGNGQ